MADYNIQSVQKALRILKIFLGENDKQMTLTEISNEINLTKSSTMRLLFTLQNEGFISYDESTKKYSLGLMVVRLGMSKYENLDWRTIVVRYLQELSNENGLICYLSIRDEYSLVYLAKVFPKSVPTWAQLMVQPGATSRLYSTGMGRLFLAHFNEEELRRYFEMTEREKITERTIVDREELLEAIRLAGKMNIAVNDCENEDYIASICAPILNGEGKMVAGISICGIRELVLGDNRNKLTEQLRSVAKTISEEVGNLI